MMKSRFALILIFCFSLPFAESYGKELKIASWNIAHLNRDEYRGQVSRGKGHFADLKRYAKRLDADIIALQEVGGADAAKKIFSDKKYDFFFKSRKAQQTGFAVKKGLRVSKISYPENLKGKYKRGRHGTDITLSLDGIEMRFLSVHLKSGCWSNFLSFPDKNNNCRFLSAQVRPLERWIDARTKEQVPFAVMGDFNRQFDNDEHFPERESFWKKIDDGKPANLNLLRVTRGHLSHCWYGEYPIFIDHIILGGSAVDYLRRGSFSELLFRKEERQFKKFPSAVEIAKHKISDHCPISAVLDIPDG